MAAVSISFPLCVCVCVCVSLEFWGHSDKACILTWPLLPGDDVDHHESFESEITDKKKGCSSLSQKLIEQSRVNFKYDSCVTRIIRPLIVSVCVCV